MELPNPRPLRPAKGFDAIIFKTLLAVDAYLQEQLSLVHDAATLKLRLQVNKAIERAMKGTT